MIKHLLTTLCALALVTTGSIPALAAEADTGESTRYCPISVEKYTYGEQSEPRINKVYQLSLSDDPSGIPRSGFVRNGRLYYLLDMAQKDEVEVDTKPHTETITRPSDTGNIEEILQGLGAELEVTTEKEYIGVLRPDHTSAQVTTGGYAAETHNLSAIHTYPNLSGAGLALIPKSIEDNGEELTLANVQWSSSGQTDGADDTVARYIATASYTGTSSYQCAIDYTVTANYIGGVAGTGCSIVTYTAIFGSMETPEESTEPESGSSTTSAGMDLSTLKLPLLIGGGIAVLAIGGTFVFKKLEEQR